MKHIKAYLEDWADELERRRERKLRPTPYVRDPNDLDVFCEVGRHKECMSPTCGCDCHTKDKIVPAIDLINPSLLR